MKLSDNEIKKLREIIEWYDDMSEREQRQFELEEELANFPTEGDGY